MNREGFFFLGGALLFWSVSSLAQPTMIKCPHLNLKQYGQIHYYDHKTGYLWSLNWNNQEQPIWDSAIIPESKICGSGHSRQGVSYHYQCAIFQCKSSAVVASLGQTRPLKCFSAYVSNQKNFYCDGFLDQ
ncbi:MAG: hypothetical protein JSR33_07605 [Proteobacteria bacterium]|nr:hypothetical protein [Pseudomonadota bacterium]